MGIRRTYKVQIGRGHGLYPWCETITSLANNLYNACRFRQRQLITAARKTDRELTDNEKGVIAEFLSVLNCNGRSGLPACPRYETFDTVMKLTKNPDYYAKGLPRQSAQQVLKRSCADVDNFFAAVKAWKDRGCPEGERPKFPGYKRKGGHAAVAITNQDCTLKEGRDGNLIAGLPFAKSMPLKIGFPLGRLKQAEVCPDNGVYVIAFSFELDLEVPVPVHPASWIAAIDFGVDNLMAVTNNCGLPCLLYKGGIVKSTNQGYNKRLAQIMQEEMKKPGCPKNKEGKPWFVPTEESMGMTLRRNNIVHDFMHKAAKHLVLWCVENRIDTIVGVNAGFKQEVNIGHINNQNFVQIPFAYLRSCIKYLCEEQGILYVKREESYTSKASFPDMDYIPTYGVDDQNVSFSGRRKPTRYRGMYKKGGFHGLYVSGNGAVINSDLNGSANILRKEYPDAFERGEMPDFNKVQVIRHPDQERNTANRETQKKNHTEPSKSKLRRERRKARIFKSNPIRIGLCE